MADRCVDAEPSLELVERRWFAALAAINGLKAECDVLLAVAAHAEDAWRQACTQLSHLEAVQEALEERLAALDEPRAVSCEATPPYQVMSAA